MSTESNTGTSSIDTKRDAIEAFRELTSTDAVEIDRAAELSEPWGMSEKILEWSSEGKSNHPEKNWFETIGVPLLLRFLVGGGTDQEPICCDEYYFGASARSIGGHAKCDRGEYKGNLAVLEQDAGMEMTYGLYSKIQNGTEPCVECGRTCIYRKQGTEIVRCVNCGTEVEN